MDSQAKYWTGVVFLMLGTAVIIGLFIEWRQWRTGRRLGNGRHFALRLVTGLLLLGILVMIFAGLVWLPQGDPIQVFLYWTLCLLLVFVVMVLALLDWRWVMERQVEQEWDITRQILQKYGPKPKRKQPAASGNGSGSEPGESN